MLFPFSCVFPATKQELGTISIATETNKRLHLPGDLLNENPKPSNNNNNNNNNAVIKEHTYIYTRSVS